MSDHVQLSRIEIVAGYQFYLEVQGDVESPLARTIAELSYDLHRNETAVEQMAQLIERTKILPGSIRMARAWATQIVLNTLKRFPHQAPDPLLLLSEYFQGCQVFLDAINQVTTGPLADDAWDALRMLEEHLLQV